MRRGIPVRSIAGLLWLLLAASSPAEAAIGALSLAIAPIREAITPFHAAKDGALFLATTGAVFRLDGDRLVPLASDRPLGPTYPGFFDASDGTLLIGTANGVFRRDGDRLVP